jgi:hypothetical protein
VLVRRRQFLSHTLKAIRAYEESLPARVDDRERP